MKNPVQRIIVQDWPNILSLPPLLPKRSSAVSDFSSSTFLLLRVGAFQSFVGFLDFLLE